MKKKILSIALASAMVLSLCACGAEKTDATASAGDDVVTEESTVMEPIPDTTEAAAEDVAEQSADKVYNIGICQLVQHVALDAATQGFQDALTELLGANVTFDLQNAAGDSATCATIANQFVASNVDLIMANATPALLSAAAATNEIPILGTSVTDYATALEIDNWAGTTGTNISGTSDLAPITEQAAMLNELFPEASTVGIIYCSAEPNSKYQATVMADSLAKLGVYNIKEYTFADSNDIAAVVTNAVSECEVLYVPTDNTAAANTEVINNIALPAGVPIIAGEEGICAGCGVATLSISYYDLGYATGKMAYEILVNGADVSTMEVQFAPQVTKEYNATNCEALGITVPEGYVAIGE